MIKFTKKTKNVKIINDTTFKGFLGSRNQIKMIVCQKKVNFSLKGHIKNGIIYYFDIFSFFSKFNNLEFFLTIGPKKFRGNTWYQFEKYMPINAFDLIFHLVYFILCFGPVVLSKIDANDFL